MTTAAIILFLLAMLTLFIEKYADHANVDLMWLVRLLLIISLVLIVLSRIF